MRDDFTQKTKEKMAQRVGYRCSHPDCGIPTRGSASDDSGTINVGFAAHITAASPDGPRYDPTFSSEQRKHHSNGIWLCGTHAKLVDSDDSHFSVEKLHRWKRLAERRSFLEVVSSKPSRTDADFADDENVQIVFARLQNYSKSDISAFQGTSMWPSHAIELNLRLVDGDSAKAFTISGLAPGIDVYSQITVIAPPGTGKTTTLLQLAEATLTNTTSVALFIPLSAWSTGSDTFFQSILKRAAFRDAKERQFELLAQHGKLVLILDGWNELDDPSKKRMRADTSALIRDFPDIRLVISSRYKDPEIPIGGYVVEVDLFTDEQQLELAKSLRASDGESLMDHAWRTPGLRGLVAIPLYLTALLKQAPGDSLPTTKEEVLSSFVAELEQDKDKRASLREDLQGYHREFLEEIGVEATLHETVALSKKQARIIVNSVQGRLKDEDQIEPLKPMKVLDALVNAHMLVRSGTEVDGIAFQHQQFQEWFASFRAQKLMLFAASGDDNANNRLRETVLSNPIWEEAVLFACERLSRAEQDGVNAVAHTILETLGIDPLLSAEMIWRSSDVVWDQIRDDVMSFAENWHMSGRVDRAFNFMIDTGRAEFSEYVWPLISDPDNQVHLRALNAGHRFRPSVLGSDVEKRISELPDEVRVNVVSEIASNSGMDGIEMVTCLAKNDTNQDLKNSVIMSLLMRRADRFAKEILETASDEVWQSLARKWHPHEFTDPEVSLRMRREVDKIFAEETNPRKVLSTLLTTNAHDLITGQKVCKLIERIDFSENKSDNWWIIHRAYEYYPDDVVAGLLSLVEQGRQVPSMANEMLRSSGIVIDDGPLVDCLLNNSEEGRNAAITASIVGAITVGQLINQTFAVSARTRADNGRHDKSLRDECHRLMGLISGTKVDSFTQAVLERAGTESPNEIHILADLISRHGGSVESEPLRLDSSTHEKLTAAVQRWAELLLASPEATRGQFAKIAIVTERLESPELVPVLLKLLSEDLARRKRAHEERKDAQKNGLQIQNDAHMCWALQYRRAFSAIGDEQTIEAMKNHLPDPEFGFDAAHVLKEIWKKTQPHRVESGLLRPCPDFSVVPDAYKNRQLGVAKEAHPFVDDIIAVIDNLIKPGTINVEHKNALKLATVAFGDFQDSCRLF